MAAQDAIPQFPHQTLVEFVRLVGDDAISYARTQGLLRSLDNPPLCSQCRRPMTQVKAAQYSQDRLIENFLIESENLTP